jgi:hypothetical protein
MSNISEETARQIACAYAEIRSAEEILSVVKKAISNQEAPDFRDAFGRQRGLQLGVPSGQNGHRLYDVSYNLGAIIVEAHLNEKRSALVALTAKAQTEISEG